jgi:hypothetical protein
MKEVIMSNNMGNEGIIQSGGAINAEQIAVGRNATVSGTVNKTIGQLQNSDAPEAPQLADLLKELQAAIETDSSLKPEEKDEALEQLGKIAEAGKSPKEGEMQKLAKTASRTLKGMLIELPNATNFVEACGKLLPLITKFFGF